MVIDPGHGGKDAGCISPSGKTMEKTVVLDIATRLAGKIREGYPDVNSLLERREEFMYRVAGAEDEVPFAALDVFHAFLESEFFFHLKCFGKPVHSTYSRFFLRCPVHLRIADIHLFSASMNASTTSRFSSSEIWFQKRPMASRMDSLPSS